MLLEMRHSCGRGLLLSAVFLAVLSAACTAPSSRLAPTTVTPAPIRLPSATVTPPEAVPTPSPTQQVNEQPPSAWQGTISIWHSWEPDQVAYFEQVMRSFQQAYPEVHFDVRYYPSDALLTSFEVDAYRGRGPSILIGPADWGPRLADSGLVADLTPFVSPDLTAKLSPPTVALSRDHDQWLSLPYAQKGIVLYRNRKIISQPPATFEELVQLAQAATHGGIVGADLERSIYFSAAHLMGLGGHLMDEQGMPAFNDEAALEWIHLLQAFEQAGPVELNSNRDVRLFKEGKAGMIFEGTWRRAELAQAVGSEYLAIDPWPSYGRGRMSGFVWAESLYLNANLSGAEQAAAMQFMGYLLAPEVQTLMAEAGFIPSRLDASPRDHLTQQAAIALSAGTPYPPLPSDSPYWDLLSSALYTIFEEGTDPEAALQQAFDNLTTRLRATP